MNQLGSNLSHLRKHHKWSQQKMANKLDIPRSTYSGYERGYAEPDIDLILQIAEIFGVSVDALLTEDFSETDPSQYKEQAARILTITIDDDGRNGIELVETKAEAGYLESFHDPEYIKDLPRIVVPQLHHGYMRAFEINGDSMLPMEPGSIVIAAYIERLDQVKNGRTYVVASKDSLVYKRVHNQQERECLSLISDNEIYAPYEISYHDIKEIWEYQAHISFSDGKEQFDALLDDRISDMHHKINGMYRKYVGGSL